MTLMDLITADPTPALASSSASAAPTPGPSSAPPTALGKPATEKKSKRATLMQIHNDTVSVAKAALNPVRTNIMPQKQKKKVLPFSYLLLLPSLVAEEVWKIGMCHSLCRIPWNVECSCLNSIFLCLLCTFMLCLITDKTLDNWISCACYLSEKRRSLKYHRLNDCRFILLVKFSFWLD